MTEPVHLEKAPKKRSKKRRRRPREGTRANVGHDGTKGPQVRVTKEPPEEEE